MNILDLIKNDFDCVNNDSLDYLKIKEQRNKLEANLCSLLDAHYSTLFKQYVNVIDCILTINLDFAIEFTYNKFKALLREIFTDWNKLSQNMGQLELHAPMIFQDL